MALEHCSHQYRSVTEEEELPSTTASTFSDFSQLFLILIDVDLRCIGSNRSLGLANVLGHEYLWSMAKSRIQTASETWESWVTTRLRGWACYLGYLQQKDSQDFPARLGSTGYMASRLPPCAVSCIKWCLLLPLPIQSTWMGQPRAKGPLGSRKGRTRPTKPPCVQHNFVHLPSKLLTSDWNKHPI